jgi:hypothetical protein
MQKGKPVHMRNPGAGALISNFSGPVISQIAFRIGQQQLVFNLLPLAFYMCASYNKYMVNHEYIAPA